MKKENRMKSYFEKHMMILYAISLVTSFVFAGSANACSDVSGNGCPTILEIDDNAATVIGVWKSSKSKLLYYGDDYEVVLGSGGAATHSVAFSTSNDDIEVDGDYSIYARWTTDDNRCTNVRHLIYDGAAIPANLITTVNKNQTINGGAWQRLTTTDQFTVGVVPTIVVDNGGCSGKFVVADGIRIVKEDNDHNSIVDEAGIEFVSGDDNEAVTTAEIIRSITITPPASGYVVVNATGYWAVSGGTSNSRCSIVQSPATAIDFTHLMIGQHNSTDSTWLPFAGTRVFSVTKNVSATIRLICDQSSGSGNLTIGDSSVSAIFSTTRY